MRLAVATVGLVEPIGIELFQGKGDSVRVGYFPETGGFFIDRIAHNSLFAGSAERHSARRVLTDSNIAMEIWTDGSTIELFAVGGTVVMGDIAYGLW